MYVLRSADSREMESIRKCVSRRSSSPWTTLIPSMACVLAFAGCSVIDVVANLGEPTTPGGEKIEEKVDPASAPLMSSGPGGNARAKLRAYYERERSSSSKDADPNNPIVRCNAQGKTHFVRKQDCEIRGGRIVG